MIKTFGSFEKLMETFTQRSVGIMGSGWGWLVLDKDGNLLITETANQETVS